MAKKRARGGLVKPRGRGAAKGVGPITVGLSAGGKNLLGGQPLGNAQKKRVLRGLQKQRAAIMAKKQAKKPVNRRVQAAQRRGGKVAAAVRAELRAGRPERVVPLPEKVVRGKEGIVENLTRMAREGFGNAGEGKALRAVARQERKSGKMGETERRRFILNFLRKNPAEGDTLGTGARGH